MHPVTILLTLLTATPCPASDIALQEVHFSSWSGDRIRQFSLRFINQASDVLECAAAAAKHLFSDQLLVFIGGVGTQEPQCIVANKTAAVCRRLMLNEESSCCTRAFVTSLDNCWTTVQHRVDNTTNFYRNWTEYAAGFGQGPRGNFWIGLRTLHSLTWPTSRSLRVRMKLWDNTEYWADYTSFSIDDETNKFRMSVSGFHVGQGNLGDSMATHNGQKFSTFDSDNDSSGANCAVNYKGAWWYRSCHATNPNALYYTLPAALNTPGYADGINWNYHFGYYYSLKEFEMLVL